MDLLRICFLLVRGESTKCSVNNVVRISLITPVQMVVYLRALNGLSAEMRTMAGVEESDCPPWLGDWFGKYTGMVVTGFLTLIPVLFTD
jgi:hypothetical protein